MSQRSKLLIKLARQKYQEFDGIDCWEAVTTREPEAISLENLDKGVSDTAEYVPQQKNYLINKQGNNWELNLNDEKCVTVISDAELKERYPQHAENIDHTSTQEEGEEDLYCDDTDSDDPVPIAPSSYTSAPEHSVEERTKPFEGEEQYMETEDLQAPEVIQETEMECAEKEKDERSGKKRKRNEKNWNKNKNKLLRNTGQAYTTSSKSGKKYNKREIRPPCNEKCKLKCFINISMAEREKIFSEYWALGGVEKQRMFISSSMTTIKPKYQYLKQNNMRKPNNAFYFSIGEKKIRICKTFFKATLDINDRPIRTVLEKRTFSAMITEDHRGKLKNHFTVSDIIKEDIRNHISSIPKIESHYTRSNTSKEFIDGSNTLADLHKDYKREYEENQKPFGNYFLYHRIFNEEFNLSFFTPKKDQCDTCVAYENAVNEEKEKMKATYEIRLQQKDLSRKEKECDKNKASENYVVSCFDLQKVLPCPNGDVNIFYYTSNLSVLNFTVYDFKNNNVQCFVWHEGEAQRGANEIGTCVLKYIENKVNSCAEGLINFVFYSDNCCGQQKNRFLIAMYMYVVQKYNIKSIIHKFLIAGHTQNENDSFHSVIEQSIKRAKKSGPIYTPDQYITLIRGAKKKGEPYKVTELAHEDIFDLRDLAEKIGIGLIKNTENKTVKMSDIKILKVEKDSPYKIFYKTGYDENVFQEILLKRSTSRKSGDISSFVLKPAYKQKLTLNEKKKNGLLSLMEKNLIPKIYGNFFKNV